MEYPEIVEGLELEDQNLKSQNWRTRIGGPKLEDQNWRTRIGARIRGARISSRG